MEPMKLRLVARPPGASRSVGTWVMTGLLVVALGLLLISGYFARGTYDLRIVETVADAGVAQIFYDTGHGFRERQSIKLHVRRGANTLDFTIPADGITSLRFDPINNDGRVIVASVSVADAGSARRPLDLNKIQPLAHASVSLTDGTLAATSVHGSGDPQLRLPVALGPSAPYELTGVWSWLQGGAMLLLLGLGCVVAAKTSSTRTIVGTGMAVVAGLVLMLAVLAPVTHSVNPDEFSHKQAYSYYLHHWLPPGVDAPSVVPSLSAWGYSYLMEWDIVYWVAARVTGPFVAMTGNPLYAARGFNVALWLGLLLLVVVARRGIWPWVVGVLVLTPQAWYVFGYFNGDAFPLAVSLICAGLICRRDGPVGQFLSGERPGAGVLLFCIAFGVLLVSKRNFIPVLPGLVLWLTALHLRARTWKLVALLCGLAVLGASVQLSTVPDVASWYGQYVGVGVGLILVLTASAGITRSAWMDAKLRKTFVRLACLVGVAVLFAAPRIGWDFVVNGGPAAKAHKQQIIAEHYAAPGFRPSDVAAGTARPTIALATSGVPLQSILAGRYNWETISARSAFGVYGYMNINAPRWTYFALGLILLGVVTLGFRSVIRAEPEIGYGLCAVVIGCAVLICLASLLHSWVIAFQAQGRYLLPILPLLALAMAYAPARLPRTVVKALLLAALLVGIYSMGFSALPALTAPA